MPDILRILPNTSVCREITGIRNVHQRLFQPCVAVGIIGDHAVEGVFVRLVIGKAHIRIGDAVRRRQIRRNVGKVFAVKTFAYSVDRCAKASV